MLVLRVVFVLKQVKIKTKCGILVSILMIAGHCFVFMAVLVHEEGYF